MIHSPGTEQFPIGFCYFYKSYTKYVIFNGFRSLTVLIKFVFSERHVLCFRRPLPGVDTGKIPY